MRTRKCTPERLRLVCAGRTVIAPSPGRAIWDEGAAPSTASQTSTLLRTREDRLSSACVAERGASNAETDPGSI